MLFRFLRQIFHDSEFKDLKNRLSLAESKIEAIDKSIKSDSAKVDIEFLNFLWLMILATAGIASVSTSYVVQVNNKLIQMPFVEWYKQIVSIGILLLYVYINGRGLLFMFRQASFGLDLLKQYATQKNNSKYVVFAKGLEYIYILFVLLNYFYAIYKLCIEPNLPIFN